ncbi:MAG: pseudaminic acid cytidylyltransferase [Candidatus Marinimicrobia bacterium]|nr:pseudaminic acid cytidylyltransferase [Candidatus Neomarinimicrobiota bacterium]
MTSKVAIIPARGGSKRIPHKNIKEFCGLPMIAYSIDTVQRSDLFDRIIVSTDDEEIARVARKYGAEVPFIRPKELADDFATTAEVMGHALDWLEQYDQEYDYVCTVYATAPLLRSVYLQQGFEKLEKSDAINAFSAAIMPFPVQRAFKITANGRCEMLWPEHFTSRSQDLEETYQDAGQFYWRKLKQTSTEIMFSKHSIPVIIPSHLVQDIDTHEDWERAELMYKILQKQSMER